MGNQLERIILVRHGYSMGNHDPDNYEKYGDSNVPLHDIGWQQTIGTGQFLKEYLPKNPGPSGGKPRIWTSPFLRTQQTTAGVVHGAQGYLDDCEIRETPFLVEQGYGLFSHMHNRDEQMEKVPEIAEFHKRSLKQSKFMTAKPLGDSPFDIYQNATHFLDTVHRDAAKGVEDIICVSHGVTTRIIPMRVFNWSMRALEFFDNPNNGDVMVMERQNCQFSSLKKVYDGQTGSTEEIDLVKIILEKAPLLSAKTLPPVPKHLRMRP